MKTSHAVRIGVVIVNYNGLELTRSCLASLSRTHYPNLKIVVIDNGSSDRSVNILSVEFPSVTFIPLSENTGFTGGNNLGIKWCLENECDAILLLNNDTEIEPAAISFMARHLNNHCMVIPQVRSAQEPGVFIGHMGDFDWQKGILEDWFFGRSISNVHRTSVPVQIGSACCLLIPKIVIESIGFFDEAFFLYYEDTDLFIRAKSAGFTLVFEPNAIVYHQEGASGGGRLSPLSIYYNNRNRLYFMRKHGALHLGFITYFFVTRFIYSARWILHGQWSELTAMWAGIIDFMLGKFQRSNRKL